jgi:signal transduction histidine kinase
MDLPYDLEEELFYLSMEALNNTLKHAGASEVVLSLDLEEGILTMKVEDNGRGFNPEVAKNQGGIGISSMIERAEKIGGSLEIQSEPDAGTVLSVRIPLGEHQRTTMNELEDK